MTFRTRREWRNDAGNQRSVPLRRYRPSSLADLQQIVKDAEAAEVTIRAVGASHSWSDVALTADFLVEPDALVRILLLDKAVLRDEVKPDYLVETESGVTLRKLNDYLDKRRLALVNMGGYDGQTVAGVTATSTHGSGVKFGPITDAIRSIDLVDGVGRIRRVEPRAGVTDPAKFSAKYGNARTLIQSDDAFHAVVVGLGCFGMIYSLILEVRDAFWLKEVRCLTTWEALKSELRRGEVLRTNEHYELLLNPYALEGTHTCLVTTRNPTGKPHDLPPDKLQRNVLTEFLSSLWITGSILRFLFNHFPGSTPKRLDDAIRGLKDDGYTNKSYKVFNIGAANDLPSLSAEYGFAFDDQTYITAIDGLLQVAADAARVGDLYQTGPIAVRFVQACPYFLSPQHGRNTVMVEMIAVDGTHGAEEMLYRYEEEAHRHDGRPHWGQLNHVPCGPIVEKMYPRLADWRAVRKDFDPRRRFDSPFTQRVGL